MSGTVLIALSRGLYATIDATDLPLVEGRKWHAIRNDYGFYAGSTVRIPGAKSGKALLMHRLIIGSIDGQVVDHINGDRLDNRRANLRLCTTSENRQNSRLQCNNTSGYRGVRRSPSGQRWVVAITHQCARKSLGTFDDREAAARAYDAAARRLHGAFARLNLPEASQ